jgi:hypothetical protein
MTVDEKALEAAIPIGSNIADAHLVRAIIIAYEDAKREAAPIMWHVCIGFNAIEEALPSDELRQVANEKIAILRKMVEQRITHLAKARKDA